MIYLIVHDDLLTRGSPRGPIKLTKCCEPFQKMRLRLEPCRIGLTPTHLFITDRSKSVLLLRFTFIQVISHYEKVHVGNDQEMVQSERNSHSINRGLGKN